MDGKHGEQIPRPRIEWFSQAHNLGVTKEGMHILHMWNCPTYVHYVCLDGVSLSCGWWTTQAIKDVGYQRVSWPEDLSKWHQSFNFNSTIATSRKIQNSYWITCQSFLESEKPPIPSAGGPGSSSWRSSKSCTSNRWYVAPWTARAFVGDGVWKGCGQEKWQLHKKQGVAKLKSLHHGSIWIYQKSIYIYKSEL